LGGCTTALFITDPSSFDVRPTVDVDCIIEVCSPIDYNKFESKLRKKGFKQHLNDIICRWHYEEIILDVMPTDENILVFSNSWYKKALTDIVAHQIAKDLVIKSIAAPYFLATKIEAFNGRGKNDFLASHDLEDIITVIDGRAEISQEVQMTDNSLRTYLKDFFENMFNNDDFRSALPGHIRGPIGRTQTVIERIKNF